MYQRKKHIFLHLGLILTSLLGYLEWGQGQHMMLAEAELDILTKLFTDPMSVLHPFIQLPMLGQLLLLTAVFLKSPPRWLTWAGIAGLGLIHGMILLISILSLNFLMMVSAIPFLGLSIFTIWSLRKTSVKNP